MKLQSSIISNSSAESKPKTATGYSHYNKGDLKADHKTQKAFKKAEKAEKKAVKGAYVKMSDSTFEMTPYTKKDRDDAAASGGGGGGFGSNSDGGDYEVDFETFQQESKDRELALRLHRMELEEARLASRMKSMNDDKGKKWRTGRSMRR